MTVTAAKITAAVDRWIAEADTHPPREAYRLLSQKVRYLRKAANRGTLPGSAWDISDALSRLLVAAAARKEGPAHV